MVLGPEALKTESGAVPVTVGLAGLLVSEVGQGAELPAVNWFPAVVLDICLGLIQMVYRS
jgi:hypothetical protein